MNAIRRGVAVAQRYVATHICDSIKRQLKQNGTLGVQGEFGIGLLSALGHKFGDVFWGSGCQRTYERRLEFRNQLAQLNACEFPFKRLGDLFIIRLKLQQPFGDGIKTRKVVGR